MRAPKCLKKVFDRWASVSIANKIYCVVGLMLILITIELVSLVVAMNIMSSVRAFVGAEGLWSKAQKQAVQSLHKYAATRNSDDYKNYLSSLAVPMGDLAARLELEKDQPNDEVIFQGFASGRIHPEDIPGVVRLLRYFGNVSYLRQAVSLWEQGDSMLSDLMRAGDTLHREILKGAPPADLVSILQEIEQIDRKLTELEDGFSYVLGEGSRFLENILMAILAVAVLTIEGTGLMLTISFSRYLSRGLGEIYQVSNAIAEGNFRARVKIESADELGKLASAINRIANDLSANIDDRIHAQSANRFKIMFLANMSHEIRTPITAIMGFTSLLKDPGITAEQRDRYITIIERTGESLRHLVDDILDLSKVESGILELELSSVPVRQVLDEIRHIMTIKSNQKGIELVMQLPQEMPEFMLTDRFRLRQILLNLMGNAIKFTDRGKVSLNVEFGAEYCSFTVSDTGIGIPTHLQNKLFQNFSQVDDSATRRHQGTGLGLALSRRLALALGGELVLIESTPQQGSRFQLRLPLKQVNQAVSASQGSAKTSLDNPADVLGRSILIVDDSEDNRLLFEQILMRRGAKISLAENGEIAVEMAAKNNFDLILMDMQMPVKDGYDATRELRQRGVKTPIIAITAHALKEDRLRCLAAGCDDYVSKPIDFKQLFLAVERNLRAEEFAHNA